MSSHAPHATSTRQVRPRWVWAGLALAVLGLMVLTAGLIELSWTWVVPGLALLGVGLTVSAYGGVLSDSRTGHPGQELSEVEHGEAHQGASPGAMVHARHAEEASRRADATRQELLAASRQVGRPNLSPVGSGLVLLTCAWLTVAQWSIYPMSLVGQNNALRDLGVALVVALAALRAAVAGPRAAAAAVMVAGGVALLLFGDLMPHHSGTVRWNELLCGLLVVTGAVMAADRGGLRRSTYPRS